MAVPKNHQQVLEFAALGKIADGVLTMPPLWSIDEHNKFRKWQIFVGIHNSKTGKDLAVTDAYIDRKALPANCVGVYWTVSGQEGTKNPLTSERTVIEVGKSTGRSNFTTPFTQAILDARSEYNKKVRKGMQPNKAHLKRKGEAFTMEELFDMEHRGTYPWRVFAMAVHDVTKNGNWARVKFPAEIDTKLDGTLFITVHHPRLPERELTDDNGKLHRERIDGYSRGRENYEGQDHILLELAPLLKKHPGMHLTGELWKKGFGLQDISGASRRTADSSRGKAERWDYNVFDCFFIDKPDMPYEERQAVLDDFFDEVPDTVQYVKRIEPHIVETKEEAVKLYNKWMSETNADGRNTYEGAVIRNLDGPYEFGIDKEKRSYAAMKWKPRPDGEWPVVGYKDGAGKEKGQVIWICAENDEGVQKRVKELLPLDERKRFAVTPNMPVDVRKHIFNRLEKNADLFEKQVKGKLATISYSILSKDWLPQQPKMLRFRDEKTNKVLLEGYEGGYEVPALGATLDAQEDDEVDE